MFHGCRRVGLLQNGKTENVDGGAAKTRARSGPTCASQAVADDNGQRTSGVADVFYVFSD